MTQTFWLCLTPRSWRLNYETPAVACVEVGPPGEEESAESGQTIFNYLPVIPEDKWNTPYWVSET